MLFFRHARHDYLPVNQDVVSTGAFTGAGAFLTSGSGIVFGAGFLVVLVIWTPNRKLTSLNQH